MENADPEIEMQQAEPIAERPMENVTLLTPEQERAYITKWIKEIYPTLDPNLKSLIKRIDEHNRDDFDSVIAITGGEGIGKSTCAAIIAMLYDRKFEFDRNELFQPQHKEVKEKLTKLPKYSVLVADEAIRILYKLKWQDKSQHYLNEVYALCRQENQTSIFCMPRFTDFNEFFRNHRIKLWIHVYQRGKAMLFAADENPFVTDIFWISESMKVVDKSLRRMRKLTLTDEIADIVFSKVRCYVMRFEYPDMPKVLQDQYKALKQKYSYANMDLLLEQNDNTALEQRNKLLYFIFKVCGFRISDLASITNLDPNSINALSTKAYNLLSPLELISYNRIYNLYCKSIVIIMKRQLRKNLIRLDLDQQNSTFVGDKTPQNTLSELESLAKEAGLETETKTERQERERTERRLQKQGIQPKDATQEQGSEG